MRIDETHDANGNTLTDAQGRSFTWDFENRLTQAVVPGTGTTTFRYDPFGRRIQKSGPLGTTNYLYDGEWENVIEEVDNSGGVLARYNQEMGLDFPLSEFRSNAASYYEQDGGNSVTSLSSSAGAFANTYTFDSFGKQTASTGTVNNPFQYTARESDPETGIYEYRARYYDPSIGRFISEDPVRFSKGELNFYDYVQGDPIDFSDPSGLFKIHGKWCGPKWTGGVKEPYTDVDADEYAAPQGYVDAVCMHHDICYFECRMLAPCDKRDRRHCERDCDHHLVHELFPSRGMISPWSWVVGIAIALDFRPPTGPNGGPKGHNVSCGCH